MGLGSAPLPPSRQWQKQTEECTSPLHLQNCSKVWESPCGSLGEPVTLLCKCAKQGRSPADWQPVGCLATGVLEILSQHVTFRSIRVRSQELGQHQTSSPRWHQLLGGLQTHINRSSSPSHPQSPTGPPDLAAQWPLLCLILRCLLESP